MPSHSHSVIDGLSLQDARADGDAELDGMLDYSTVRYLFLSVPLFVDNDMHKRRCLLRLSSRSLHVCDVEAS
jgi:hypothetical protein